MVIYFTVTYANKIRHFADFRGRALFLFSDVLFLLPELFFDHLLALPPLHGFGVRAVLQLRAVLERLPDDFSLSKSRETISGSERSVGRRIMSLRQKPSPD